MSFITNAAISHLEERDYLVFEPGPSQRANVVLHLAEAGFNVFPNSNAALVEHLRLAGYIVHANALQAQQAAVKAMRAAGARIFLPPALPVPGAMYWSKRDYLSRRLVLPCREAGRVAYRNLATMTDHVIAEASWQRWVTAARAKVVV